jgi:hypothetical protein
VAWSRRNDHTGTARIVKQWRERDPDTAALAKGIWSEGVDPAGTVAEE